MFPFPPVGDFVVSAVRTGRRRCGCGTSMVHVIGRRQCTGCARGWRFYVVSVCRNCAPLRPLEDIARERATAWCPCLSFYIRQARVRGGQVLP